MRQLALASRVRRWRLPPGVSAPRGAPVGVSRATPLDASLEPGDAVWLELRGVDLSGAHDAPAAVAQALPDPVTLPGVTIVLAPSRARLFERLVGREVHVSRSVRGSALLLRGYVDVGGGRDPSSGLDLCWAVAPT